MLPSAAGSPDHAALHETVLRLRAAGWPPAFLLVYDEVWVDLIDPLFEAFETLLGEGCTMADDVNVWALRRPVETAGKAAVGTAAYSGQNFGRPHRDMAYARCHRDDEQRCSCLNAWVPLNPSGATARNGAMRLLPRQHDAGFEGSCVTAAKEWLHSPLAHVAEVPAGSIVTWAPCVVHWGGACDPSAAEEPRVSVAATFCASDAPAVYGVADGVRPVKTLLRRRRLPRCSLSRREDIERTLAPGTRPFPPPPPP